MKETLVIALMLCAPAYAKTTLCQQLATQIERAQISMAQDSIDASNENSAARFTAKEGTKQ